jgi:hypothetical protein
MSFSIILIERVYFHDNAQKVALENGVKKVKEREHTFQAFLTQSNNVLLSLRNSNFFKTYIAEPKNINDVQDLFITCATSSAEFMQLRYIDKDGNEKIRVERLDHGGNIFVSPKEQLQNKADRYYFFHSKEEKLEKVWFSALDLNIEHNKVEIPYKPTLRAVLPIEKMGNLTGLLLSIILLKSF